MSVSYKSTTSLATGSWQHLAVTVDQTKGTVSFFMNNRLVGTQTASISMLQNSHNILVGRNTDSEFFNGMMDDVRVYSRVLSADELGSLFNYKNEGSLISKYDFEKFDLSEMKVYDEGPYGYTGTLMNVGANENALTNEVGDFAINKTAFESLVDEYVEIDGSDPTNKLQGTNLNNCTFAAWVKLGANTDTFEPIMVKPGVLSFGVNNGRVVLKLGDGSALHELPVMSVPDMQMDSSSSSDSGEQIRISNNGYSTLDVLPAPTPSNTYLKKMGYRGFEWSLHDHMYDNSTVFKLHTVDARSKTHNKFYVNDQMRMAASFGQLSTSRESYMVTNWCRETNNEYWYLRAGYDGMEMPAWGVGKSPLTLTMRFKFLDPSNLNTSAVSIMYGQGAADEGLFNQTWNHAQHENYHVAAELYGNAATTFQMRCSVQAGKAGTGRTVSTVFSGTMNDIYATNWNTMTLVHDPTNTKTLLYLNYTMVCSVNAVTTFPSADLCKLRVGTYPIDTAKYVNRGIHMKDINLLDTALSEAMVKHYFQNSREDPSSEISSKGLKAHYTFDQSLLGQNSSGHTNHIVDSTGMVADTGVVEGSRAVRFEPTNTDPVEIPGEVFSSDKSFFFGTWIKPESLSGYRPIVSRTEGDNTMHFGVRNGVLEFSASRSAPVTLSEVSGKHVYDHHDASRVCEVRGTVSNSDGGTVYLGLFQKFYSDLMKSDLKTFMLDTMTGSLALKEFTIPSDAFGVSIDCSMSEFFSDLNSSSPQELSFATQQLNLVILVVDPSDKLTVKSYPLEYTVVNGADGAHTSGKSELYLSDGYTYSLTTMREEDTPEEYTDWYLVMNYLRKENETVRAVPRTPIGMSSSNNTGYEGFPIERQAFESVDINGEFASETYDTLDMNAREFGPWGHADNELFGMMVDKLGDQGVELLFKGKTASHERVMNFSTGWSWLVDYFRNGFEVAPGGFNDSAVQKRSNHTTNLPDETTTFPDNKMDFAMTKYPFYHTSYRNYLGADNDSYWSLDESAKNTTMFQQIWVRGRRDLASRSMKPMMISNNDARNKSLSMGSDCVTGEPYAMVLTNGDTVEMSDCYKDANKKVSNLFSHSMNDNNHSSYGAGNNWRAIYTFAKGEMEAVSMKFYQAESYQTKQIEIYYTDDDTVSITSPLEDWTPVNNPSLTEFHTNTTRTILRIDFSPVKSRRFMIATKSWNASHTYYGLMEWMIYGYDGSGNGVISDMSDKNAQHNNADSKFTLSTGYEFNSGERTLYRITDSEDPYYKLFLHHMNENRGIEDSAFGGSDHVMKAQLNNDDVIYYNSLYSYFSNTGWVTYDATNMFKDETILNVIHQNAYNSYQTQGWRFAQSSVTASPRTGTLIYEFAKGRMQKIRGIQVHGHTNNSMGFSAKVRVFYSMSDTELDFVEFEEAANAISLLISDTNTFVEFGEEFPATNKIMLVFESVWEENFDVAIRDLRIIGEPVPSSKIITANQLTLQKTNDVVTGKFKYSNLTGSAKLYVNAYAYDYTGAFVSTVPTMTLSPTVNKTITIELTTVQGIDGTLVPAKAVNYMKVFVLIEDSVMGTRNMLNVAKLLPQNQGEVNISIERLFYDGLLDVVHADLYAYSSYAGITGVYGLLTRSHIEDDDESNAKSFILQNASTSNGCVVYKSVSVPQYGICSETFGFSHALSEMGGIVRTVSSGESYYLSVLLENSSGGTTFSKRNLPAKSIYYDLNRIFAGGHDSSHSTTGFGNSTDRRQFGEGNSLKTWLSANTNLVVREVIGGGHHGYVWCHAGDDDVVYGWGYNGHGELAYIPSGTTHNTSTQVNPVECNAITRLLREKKARIVQFKSGNNFGMLLLSDGKMYSWGNISSYATGFSENKTHTTIEECDIFSSHCSQNNVSPVDFACTQSNTIVLFSDGTVWGIGNNSNGLLGVGHTNATGPVLVACTNLNLKLEEGYEVDLMCARGNAMTYRLKKEGTEELSWWGMGENRHNRSLGTAVVAPVLDLTRLDLMEDLIATFPDPKNYVVAVGPSHWTNCCIIDLTSNTFWFVGYGHYLHWSDYPNWTDRTSQVNMGSNKFVFCAMFSYGIFLASTNDRAVEYTVLDTRSIITSHRLNVTNASTDWTSSTGVTFNGTILASDVYDTSTYTFYATSDMNMTREQAMSVMNTGTSPALQTETISINERLSLRNHIVRNMDVNGKVVPSNSYPKYTLFVYAKSNDHKSMEVLRNEDAPVPNLFPNVVEGSFDPYDKTLKVKASVTDALETPTDLYVAAFAEPPSNSVTNADIKNIILNTKHLSQVKALPLNNANTNDVFLSNTLSFDQVFGSVYPQIDETTYASMQAIAGTQVVSENSDANIGLTGSTSDATWYVWENKYQSGQTVKKWTLHNGDSVYTNSHGEKWFDGNQEDDASYQPQMYNTNETWVVQGTSRASVKSWRYFYDVAEERTINTFKLFNHSTNGAQFIKSIAVWNNNKNIYEPVQLNSGSFPMNCFEGTSTSAYKNMHLNFESMTLQPGKPLMIHLGKMATNLYINEMQLVYETPPPVIPTFFKYVKLRVRANNGSGSYFAFGDISVLNMEIESISSAVSTAHGHVISRIADDDPDTYHQTESMGGFDVFISFTHGLPSIFQMKMMNIWNNQGWKDVDVYVSTDNTSWVLSKEIRGLGYAVKDDLLGRSTVVECALPPNVVSAEDIEYSIYAVAKNSVGDTSISKFTPPPTRKAYLFDRVKSMGYNNHHESAQGTDKTAKSFDIATEVIKFLESNPSVKMIDIIGGGHFAIFEVRNNGQQQFYGIGYNTQRGIGGFDDTNHQPTVVECTGITALMASEKSLVKKVACGWYHTMVLLENGKMYGFGYNGYGNLGTNNASDGGKDGRESIMINAYCEENNTSVVDFACGAYNTFVYLKNNTIRVAGRWNGHGQLGRNNTTETNNTTFYHVSHMDSYLNNATLDFMKCDYGSVMYRVVKKDTGEAKWYGAGQNTDKSIGYNGGQTQVIVECDLLNSFVEEKQLHGNYEVVKGIMRSTMLIDNRDRRLYGIGDFGANNPDMSDVTSFMELTNNEGIAFLNYDELMEDSSYPMRVVKYATLGHGIFVGGTAITGTQPFEYLTTPTGNLNILRINNLALTPPDRKGVASLTLNIRGSILNDTRYYVVLTTDDRDTFDFDDEGNASAQATYSGLIERNDSLSLEVAISEISDISGEMISLGIVSKVRGYVFVTDGVHRDYQVYTIGPYVSHPVVLVDSGAFSPITDGFEVKMQTCAPLNTLISHNTVLLHPDVEFPEIGLPISYDTPLVADSYGNYHAASGLSKFTVSAWAAPGERTLMKQAGAFEIAIDAYGRMHVDIQTVYDTAHLERQVEVPASSTLWRFKIYKAYGGHSDYTTFTQLVLTDDNGTYPTARYDQGADTFFDGVGTTNTNVYLYNHGHKVTYEYASDFTPTKLIWAYKATDPTRAPTRFLIQYCSTTNRTTEADWKDYAYVNLEVNTATNTTPTFHYLDINVVPADTPRTIEIITSRVFKTGPLLLLSPESTDVDDQSVTDFVYMQSSFFADQTISNKRGSVKYVFNRTYHPESGNYGDWVGTANADGIWAVFDLGSVKSVTHLRMWHTTNPLEMPHDFKIAMFDDTTTIDSNLVNGGTVGQLDAIDAQFQYSTDTPDEHIFMWKGVAHMMQPNTFGDETKDPMVLYSDELTLENMNEDNAYHQFNLSSSNLRGRYMVIGFKHNPVTNGEYTKLQELRLYVEQEPSDSIAKSFDHMAVTLDSSRGEIQIFKNGLIATTSERNYIRMPTVERPLVLDSSANTRYVALRKGLLSKKNIVNEHFSGREDLISLVLTNSSPTSVNLPKGKFGTLTTTQSVALTSLDPNNKTSVTVVPDTRYRVLSVLTDVNGSILFGENFSSGRQYTTVTYGWGSGHNNGYMMMFADGLQGNPDFYPTKIFNDFMSANPTYKCLDIEMGGYALMCMIEIDGVIKLYSTGYNAQGQIGNGNTSNQSTMVEAKLFNDYALENNTTVKMVQCGWNTTCVLYENGIVMCIGTNNGNYANGNDTASSTALVEASLVTTYCREHDVIVVNFAIANGECCYLFSNGKVLGNGMAMGTSDNAHNQLKETGLNDLMGTDYECTLIRSMHASFNFRLTHKTTNEEQWYGTGEQYHNGGGAPANQTYNTSITRLTKLETLLATFEDPSDYTYVIGCNRGMSFVRDNRTGTFWRIGYFAHIPQFGNVTNFTETTTYITTEWCETNTHSRLDNFTPVYWRMNGYGIFAFGNPLGVEPYVVGGNTTLNLSSMSIEDVQGSFEPFPAPVAHVRHSDVGTANDHQTQTTSTEPGMTYVQTLSNGDKAHSSSPFQGERNVAQIFTGVYDNWSTGAWHGPSGTTTMSAIYEFTSGDVAVDSMNFVNVPGNNHWAGDIQISYWDGSGYVDVTNRSADGFENAVHSEEISVTFDQVTSTKFRIVVDKHTSNTTSYVGLSEWSIHGPNASVETSVEAMPNTLYTSVTMKGSTTESTYYAVATLDSTMDIVRMRNLISTSNPAIVSGKLEKNADAVTKSLILNKVVDAQSNHFDLTTVPYAYLFVYLKDAFGLEDFDATAQIIRPNVDLSHPYLQIKNAIYDSGGVFVEGTLFNKTAQLTGYYVSAFQNTTPGEYLASDTPTALPTGESMVAVSTAPGVPLPFTATLDTVYADDSYASSSDLFGKEGQLALRLITTDDTTSTHKDFDYTVGDFIVSTVAGYESTNDSITATVTKKNNIDPEKIYQYIVFASISEVSYTDIIEVAVAEKYKTIRSISDTEPVSVSKVIDLQNNSVYDLAEISAVSLYTFATEVPPSAGLDVGAPPTAKKYWKVWWNIATASHRYNRNGEIGIYNSRYLEVEPGQQMINHPEPHVLASALTGPISNTHNIPKLYDGTYIGQQYDFGNSRDEHSIVFNFSEPQSIVQILANGPHDETISYLGGIKVMKIYSSDDNSTWTQIGTDIPFETVIKEHAVTTGTSSHLNIWHAYVQSLQFVDGDWSYRGSFLCPDFASYNKDPNDYTFTPSIEIPPLSTNPVPYPIGSLNIPYSITETRVSRTMPFAKIGETDIEDKTRLIVKGHQISAVKADSTLYTFGIKLSPDASTTHIKTVTASGGKYIVDGAEQPTITIYAGDHLNMVIDASSHPLWIKTVESTGPSNAVLDVINNGAENGVLFWTPTAVGTYHYNCQYHSHMKGVIHVLDKLSMTHLSSEHVTTLANTIFSSDVTSSESYTSVAHVFGIRAESGAYYLNDLLQPIVEMAVGDTVAFNLDGSMSGHPLWVKTERSTGNNGAITEVSNNGASSGTVSWSPGAAGTYYYNCQHHSGMGGSIVVTDPVPQTHVVSNNLSNVFTKLISSTDITFLTTPTIFTEIFTSVNGDVKPLEDSDQNILVVSLLKNEDNVGYLSKYAILQMDVDVSGAEHGTNNGHSILTEVTENGFTHRNTHGTWSYYVKLDSIGLDGIGFNSGLVFEYKTDRSTAHRYQPITLLQDQTPILSVYCSFHSNSFQFSANMSTSTQSALRSQLVLGDDYKISGTTTLSIDPKNGTLSDVTHMFHRFIFVDHETDPDLFDIVFEFLDQDRNLIFRSRMDYFHTNSATSFGGATNFSNFSKSMTSFDLRVYSYANQTAIQYSDFYLTNKNAVRDSFTPTTTSSFGANQSFSS